jgi:DMSO/TMAO reductase YedYZ molybdopterin-dependent catalytic subunit
MMMKTATKLVIVTLVILGVALVPLYLAVHPQDAPEGALQVRGNVNTSMNLTLSELQTLPASTIQATLKSSGHPDDQGTFNYTGVSLWSLLEQAGISSNASSIYVQQATATLHL